MKLIIVEAAQTEAYLYALGGLADNEHDKGCDEAFCNSSIDSLTEKLASIKEGDAYPAELEMDFPERFTLHSAADIFQSGADEICDTPNTEDWLAQAVRLTDEWKPA